MNKASMTNSGESKWKNYKMNKPVKLFYRFICGVAENTTFLKTSYFKGGVRGY